MPIYHDAPKEGQITELYAFLAEDETGEGIMGATVGGMTIALVTSKLRVVGAMRPMARIAGKTQGKKVKLVKFTNREDIETIV